MAKKNDNYYLINGVPSNMNTLIYPYNGQYVKNVQDISDIDIATLELNTNLFNTLEDANPTIKLIGKNYIVKYPYAKGIKVFKPIEVFKATSLSDKFAQLFMDIAYERNYNYYHNLPLDAVDNGRILDFVYSMFNHFSNLQKTAVLSIDSTLGTDVKSYYYTNNFKFEQQIVSYTQVRQLLIDYLHFIARKDMPVKQDLYSVSDNMKYIDGLTKEDPMVITAALKEYKAKLLQIQNEKEIIKAKKELEEGLELPHQMELSDYFPDIPRVDNVINKKTRK